MAIIPYYGKKKKVQITSYDLTSIFQTELCYSCVKCFLHLQEDQSITYILINSIEAMFNDKKCKDENTYNQKNTS